MSEEKVPNLPPYASPNSFLTPKQQAPLMKLMGKMMAKRLPRLGRNPHVHSQNVSIKHKKKVTYW